MSVSYILKLLLLLLRCDVLGIVTLCFLTLALGGRVTKSGHAG